MPLALLVAALAAGALSLVPAFARYPYDDAFIHLRIARNLANHGEPFYNLGEPVLGTSSPVWTGALALMLACGLPGESAVRLLAGLSIAALILAIARLLADTNGKIAAPAKLLLALPIPVLLALPSAGYLMESALALALLGAGVAALGRGHGGRAGAWLTLAAATRPELASAPLLSAALAGGQRRAVLLGSFRIATPIAILLLAAFGTVVPHPILAKRVVYPLSLEEHRAYLPLPTLVLTGLAAAAAILGALRSPASEPSRLPVALLAAQALVTLLTYELTRAFVFPWYFPLVTVPLAFAALLGAFRAAGQGRRSRPAAVGAALLAGAALSPMIRDGVRELAAVLRDRPGETMRTTENARLAAYTAIGTLLTARCPGATVMAPEIGALGWSYEGRILDGVGLISPEVLPFHPLRVPAQRPNHTIGAVPYAAVAALRPDVLVVMDTFASDLAANEAGVRALGYSAFTEIPVFDSALRARGLPESLWGSRRILVLARSGCSASTRR